jgi:hypothetical protein
MRKNLNGSGKQFKIRQGQNNPNTLLTGIIPSQQ